MKIRKIKQVYFEQIQFSWRHIDQKAKMVIKQLFLKGIASLFNNFLNFLLLNTLICRYVDIFKAQVTCNLPWFSLLVLFFSRGLKCSVEVAIELNKIFLQSGVNFQPYEQFACKVK